MDGGGAGRKVKAMNCFEARHDFGAFWRRELPGERRAALRAHLARCARCDHAFRAFALTAPVLHSDSQPPLDRPGARTLGSDSRSSANSSVVRARRQEGRRWIAMCAAVTLFVAASVAAWLSVTTPVDSLSDAMSRQDQSPVRQLFEQSTAGTSNDFAG